MKPKYILYYESFDKDLPKSPWWKFWKWGENEWEMRPVGRIKIEPLENKKG